MGFMNVFLNIAPIPGTSSVTSNDVVWELRSYHKIGLRPESRYSSSWSCRSDVVL